MNFKLNLITVGLCLAIFGTLDAQSKDRFSIGPRVGVNFSDVTNVDNSKSLTGLLLGLTSTYSLNEKTGLTIDLLYSAEGFKRSDIDYRINYLQIPIYYDLFFNELGDKFRPKIYAGLVPGFFLSASEDGVKLEDPDANGFVIGLSGGFGFNYRVSNRIWLNTDLRATAGLSDIRDTVPNGADPTKGSTISLSLGLAYGLSKL